MAKGFAIIKLLQLWSVLIIEMIIFYQNAKR